MSCDNTWSAGAFRPGRASKRRSFMSVRFARLRASREIYCRITSVDRNPAITLPRMTQSRHRWWQGPNAAQDPLETWAPALQRTVEETLRYARARESRERSPLTDADRESCDV